MRAIAKPSFSKAPTQHSRYFRVVSLLLKENIGCQPQTRRCAEGGGTCSPSGSCPAGDRLAHHDLEQSSLQPSAFGIPQRRLQLGERGRNEAGGIRQGEFDVLLLGVRHRGGKSDTKMGRRGGYLSVTIARPFQFQPP